VFTARYGLCPFITHIRLVKVNFVTEVESVYGAVRTESLYNTDTFSLSKINCHLRRDATYTEMAFCSLFVYVEFSLLKSSCIYSPSSHIGLSYNMSKNIKPCKFPTISRYWYSTFRKLRPKVRVTPQTRNSLPTL